MTETYWPDYYMTPEREDEPNWNWLDLWHLENPNPARVSGSTTEDFEVWSNCYRSVVDRIWVAWALPQFHVFDWPEERVQTAREMIRGLVCGVCGRIEDPGCVRGC